MYLDGSMVYRIHVVRTTYSPPEQRLAVAIYKYSSWPHLENGHEKMQRSNKQNEKQQFIRIFPTLQTLGYVSWNDAQYSKNRKVHLRIYFFMYFINILQKILSNFDVYKNMSRPSKTTYFCKPKCVKDC
jgi:hypothetical protein